MKRSLPDPSTPGGRAAVIGAIAVAGLLGIVILTLMLASGSGSPTLDGGASSPTRSASPSPSEAPRVTPTPSPSLSRNATPSPTPTPSASPSPKVRAYEERGFTISVPVSWKRYKRAGSAPREYGYSDGKGHYLKVLQFEANDPVAREFTADIMWELRSSGTGYVVAKKDPQCTADTDEVNCPSGDDELEGYALIRSGDEPGDVYAHHFQFGFTHAESGVDTQVFERIIQSLMVD